jgi:hypothetical protein
MAFESISQYEAAPVFQTLIAQGQTTNPIFSFKLSTSGSELTLGGVDSSLYSGGFTYAKVEHKASYSLRNDSRLRL